MVRCKTQLVQQKRNAQQKHNAQHKEDADERDEKRSDVDCDGSHRHSNQKGAERCAVIHDH